MSISIDKRVTTIIITLLFFASGCEKGPAKDKQILAKINNYEMTISDFQDEARLTRANRSLSSDKGKAKAQLLEDLINKKILVQEALKLNFDKDKTFMKEIERYWEQALLKLLFKNKSEELSRDIWVYDSEVRRAFAKMSKEILAQFVVLTDQSAAQQLSHAASNFDELKNTFKGFIAQETTQWWSWRDLPKDIEDILFGLKPGEISRVFKYSDNWAVVKVLKEKDAQTEPFEKAALYITDEFLKQKKAEALESWIDNVRKKARVEINQKLLEEITIE